MSQYQNESKLQGWRALAIEEDGTEHLLFVGRSSTQVRAGYVAAYLELLDEEERGRVRQIALQRWTGAADEGRWHPQATLTVPPARIKRPLAQTA